MRQKTSRKQRLQKLLSVTENEHKNMSGNIPEMLVLKWNWKKAKKCGGFSMNANIITQLSS